MTYGRFQEVLSVLLIGDNEAPSGSQLIAALEMAYIEVTNKTTPLKLLTTNKDNAILRMGPGDTYLRMPKLPKDATESLDIDSELVPAVARIVASYVSREKVKIHIAMAQEIMRDYENKVLAYMEEMDRRKNVEEGYDDA